MKILKGSITALAGEGRARVQIPELALTSRPLEYEEAPDEWFIRLSGNNLITRETTGFLFLSPIGWEANKDKIKAAFEGHCNAVGIDPAKSWNIFEDKIASFYREVEQTNQNKLARPRRRHPALPCGMQ